MLSETFAIRSCALIPTVSATLQFQDLSRSSMVLRLAFSMTRSTIGLQVTFVS